MMKSLLKTVLPSSLIGAYHRNLALLGAMLYRHPSRSMIVIGVTGTNGKSTTVNWIAQLLRSAGWRVGATSTVLLHDGEREWLNDLKMTMPGRFALQGMLSRMRQNGCRAAVIETSSEGIKQFRHLGIEYDVAVFTNLTPEHLESHGGFENYRRAKTELFLSLNHHRCKTLDSRKILKTIVVNLDDEQAETFLSFPATIRAGFSLQPDPLSPPHVEVVKGKIGPLRGQGQELELEDHRIILPVLGRFNAYNALCAFTVARVLGVEFKTAIHGLMRLTPIPGRLETIEEGQPFTVLVDYAPEPESLRQLYATITSSFPHHRVIHVLGSCGGGRDVARRPILGHLAGEYADLVIVTNEDPYDDDPMEIIRGVAMGAIEKGKKEGTNLLLILDRREAIARAIQSAQDGDLVLITGKGAEQAMVVANGQKIPWDDRRVAREELNKIKQVKEV